MPSDILKTKSELNDLVVAFANLADENRIHDQMHLFTADARVQIWIGENLLFDVTGPSDIEKTFVGGTSHVTRSFHMLGQQQITVAGDTATGIVYCQVKLVSMTDDVETVADSSIIYTDTYRREGGRWLIASRISRFTIVDTRPISG